MSNRNKEKIMRIAIMGQAAFGAKVLETLSDRGEEIIAAWLPQGKTGAQSDPLKTAADSRGIPSCQPKSYKAPETLEAFRATNPDLLIMAFVTDIIPLSFVTVPTQGTICYHPSLLPRHRGGSAINWALIMGDRETGLSIFWTDAGIDTGPVLLQKRIPIGPADTTGSLYFNRLFPLGVEAIAESVDLIRAGRAPRLVQDESQATYEPLCNDRVALIDWGKSAAEVYNLIRGCDPQPGAYTFYQGRKVRFFDARLAADIARPEAGPGEVLAADEGGLTVAACSGAIRIVKVRTDAGKQDAAAFAATERLKPGDRFTAA
ncbi:MAG: methionyl-tRNA formyltransferase [Deltaproteobacteria bacterium]|nr:methionyl-tRNA formyltransferase [Deltaproteobacteria bacterium]